MKPHKKELPVPQSRSTYRIQVDGKTIICRSSQTVLEVLRANDCKVNYSCAVGSCLDCVIKAEKGRIPQGAQQGLSQELRDMGYFLSCLCCPIDDLIVVPEPPALLHNETLAIVNSIEQIGADIYKVLCSYEGSLNVQPGQSIEVTRSDGLMRRYSVANVVDLNNVIEFHIRRYEDGALSSWITDEGNCGVQLKLSRPAGKCVYDSKNRYKKLFLLSVDNGISALQGMLIDAILSEHQGDIEIYHGQRYSGGLYLHDTLLAYQEDLPQLQYFACSNVPTELPHVRQSNILDLAFAKSPDLTGVAVYLSGEPVIVSAAKRLAIQHGASRDDIFIEPFRY